MAEDRKAPYDAGDEGQVKTRKRKVKTLEMDRANDLLWVMGTPQGRRVMWDLWCKAGIGRMSFNPSNPHWTDFNEGARNLGQMLLDEVTTLCPELYLKAMAEANEKKKEDEADA